MSPSVPRFARDAEAFALRRIDENVRTFADRFPSPASEHLQYRPTEPYGWTSGFWTGMVWLAHELTGETRYRELAESHLEEFGGRLESGEIETHDLGFLFTLSAVAQHRLTGSEHARARALDAADALVKHRSDLGIVEPAVSSTTSEDALWEPGEFIVDTVMNLPLLYWATETTGDDRYATTAITHIERTTEHLVRADGSTFQTCRLDPETGEPLRVGTYQGHAADSCWARGQAWAIYGYALAYRYTGSEELLEVGKRIADYYVDAVPPDHVPYWDLVFQAEDDEERDSSAAAIAACGLDELANVVPNADPSRQRYEHAARGTLESLAGDYLTEGTDSNGILAHGVYNRPDRKGVDECCLWGDFFFFEGIVRVTQDLDPFW